ncbi:MAG: flagellar assembly protein FliH [Candidatus Azotimanducaceae bacterium]|jgi:flagellar assembly protein FliH
MAKLPGRIPASQVTNCSGWLPPEIDGNGKTIRLTNQLKPGRMDLRLELSGAPTTKALKPAQQTELASPAESEKGTSTEDLSAGNSLADSLPPEDLSANTPSVPEATESMAAPADSRNEADGYANGYAEGHKKGETEGFIQGEKAGHDSGISAGNEAGKKQAEANFTAEVVNQRKAIQSLQKAFVQPPDYDKNLQEGLVDLITELTKVVVCHELKTRPEFIQSLVEEAISALPHGMEIPRVFVNPADIEFLQSMSSHDVELVPDSGLARGGCRVVAGQSQIEAGLSKRILDALTAACRGEELSEIKDLDLQNIESTIEVDLNQHAE